MSTSNQDASFDSLPVRHGPYPEFTWTAILVGWAIGVLIAISISYAALKLGFSIEGSELAAILGWGILRGIMRRTSILENNINQTIASAVNGASSGIMFSVPALFILSKKPGLESVADFNVPLMVFACIAGSFIGLAFVIPLRKQMIDFQRLPYPGGIAVAAILKSPGAGIRKAVMLFGAAILSAVVYLLISQFGAHEHVDYFVGDRLGIPARYNLVFFGSLMTIGVGFLSGKGGFWFGAGGFICYWLLSPLLAMNADEAVQALVDIPSAMRGKLYKPTGIGMLIGAAIGGIIMAFPLIRSAIGSMAKRSVDSGKHAAQDDEMPIKVLALAVVVGALLLVVLAYRSAPNMSLGRAVLMSVMGTVWIWIAGVIVAECMGRTNWSPLSGMTLIAITILIVIANTGDKPATIVSSMVVGAAICLAISQASDMMLDLKSGYLVGAIPRRQQMAQFVGAWLGPIIVIALMFVLEKGAQPTATERSEAVAAQGAAEETVDTGDIVVEYGIGSRDMPAAQAMALASVIEGIVDGNVPAYRYVAAAGLGLMLAVSGLGGIGVMVALGFYMPFDIVLTYTVGCILRIVCDKTAGHRFSEEVGIPIAAGLIVGEALVGVGIAINKVFDVSSFFFG
jgi:putative OPT family oligopeptide transporter